MDSKKSPIRDAVRERSRKDTEVKLSDLISEVTSEGYDVEFGTIGKKSTYALLTKGEEEIVGYTFIRSLKYFNEDAGKVKALQQAIARKELLTNPKEDSVNE